MEIIDNEEHLLSRAYYVIPSSAFRAAYYAAGGSAGILNMLPLEVSSFKAIDFSDSWPTTPASHIHVATGKLFEKSSLSGRQRNKKDTPPGLGYIELSKTRAYIPMTTLNRSFTICENLVQMLRHPPYLEAPNERILFNGSWILNNLGQIPLADQLDSSGESFREADNKAIRNLYASLNKRVKVNGGVMLAELKESMGTLGKACTSLLLAVREVKRGRLDKAMEILLEYAGGRATDRNLARHLSRAKVNKSKRKAGDKPVSRSSYIANGWLETHFAWMPIIKDIYEIIAYIEDAAKELDGETTWLSFSGYSGWVTRSTKNSQVPGLEGWSRHKNLVYDFEERKRIAYTATFKVSDPLADVLNSVGLLNPASIAWELVPFSFVIDWFTPIGTWIESFTAHAGLDVIEVCRSVRSEFTLVSSSPQVSYYGLPPGRYNDPSWSPNGNECTEPGLPVKIIRHSFERSVISSADNPELPPFPPVRTNLEAILEPWKLLTSLALFKAITGKR